MKSFFQKLQFYISLSQQKWCVLLWHRARVAAGQSGQVRQLQKLSQCRGKWSKLWHFPEPQLKCKHFHTICISWAATPAAGLLFCYLGILQDRFCFEHLKKGPCDSAACFSLETASVSLQKNSLSECSTDLHSSVQAIISLLLKLLQIRLWEEPSCFPAKCA